MLIINSNLYSHVQLASYSYLVPEREHDVCPPTGIQLLSTNATSDDNPTAMFVDCGGFGILSIKKVLEGGPHPVNITYL